MNATPLIQPEVGEADSEFKPAATRSYFEIHLDSGTVILTESCWEDGHMVMYKQYGGSMGIDKNRVKKIVHH